MKHTITETKIRSIVRKELQSYLIQEGLWDNIKGAATALKKDLGGHFGQNIQNIGKNFGIPGKSIEQYEEISTILKKVNVSAEPLKNDYIIYTKDKENKFVYAREIKQKDISFAIEEVKKIHKILEPLFKYVENVKAQALKEAKKRRPKPKSKTTNVQQEQSSQEILAGYVKVIETIKGQLTQKKQYFLTENNQVGALTLDIVIFSADFAGRLLGTDLFPAHVKVAREFFETIVKHLELLNSAQPPVAEAPPTAETTSAAEPATAATAATAAT